MKKGEKKGKPPYAGIKDPTNCLLTGVEVLEYFGYESRYLSIWIKQGLVKSAYNKYCPYELCSFVATLPQKQKRIGKVVLEHIKTAQGFLDWFKLKPKKTSYRPFSKGPPKGMLKAEKLQKNKPGNKVIEDPEELKEVLSFDKNKLGLRAAVERLRAAEYKVSLIWQNALDNGDSAVMAYSFKLYGDIVDLLRKAENDSLKVLKDQGVLMPADEVKKMLTEEIIKVKKALLRMPSKTAAKIVKKEYPEIKKTLDEEVREICEKFSKTLGNF